MHVPLDLKRIYSLWGSQLKMVLLLSLVKINVSKRNGHSHRMTCFNGGTLLSIKTGTSTKSLFVLTNQENNTLLSHQRLGNLNLQIIRAMQSKTLVLGLIGSLKANIPLFESCLASKQTSTTFPCKWVKMHSKEPKALLYISLACLFPQNIFSM